MPLTGVRAMQRHAHDSLSWVSSELRKLAGDQWKGLSPTILFMCELTKGNDHKQAAVLSFYAFASAGNESVACSNKPTLFFVVNSGFNNISTAEPGCLQAALCRTPTDINSLYPTGSRWLHIYVTGFWQSDYKSSSKFGNTVNRHRIINMIQLDRPVTFFKGDEHIQYCTLSSHRIYTLFILFLH